MRIALAAALLLTGSVAAWADHPTLWPEPPIGYNFEPIPPLGNNLPPSYRARYNRPRYLAGKIAYHIAPTSQEAMSWHVNVHRGAYRNHAGWIEPMYMYPKPWEVLPVGPRTPVSRIDLEAPPEEVPPTAPLEYGDALAEPVIVGP